MALYKGLPVLLSQTTVVSRWLVIPMAAISFTVNPVLVMVSAAVPNCVLHISVASCSTQPGRGNICVNSFCATETIFPCLLKIIERELVVPWSNDKIYCGMKQWFVLQNKIN